MESTLVEKVEIWEIEKLSAYPNNCRIHSEDQIIRIAASIVEFGFNNPILVSAAGEIHAGHARFSAALHLRLKKVPVIVLQHLNNAQGHAYNIADNRLAELSKWDDNMLARELDALSDVGINLDAVGFTDEELTTYSSILQKDEEDENEEEEKSPAIEPQKPIVIQIGDHIIMGKHRLICGDALSYKNYEKLLQDKRPINLVFAEPPARVYSKGRSSSSEMLYDEPLTDFLKTCFRHAYFSMHDGASIYVRHPDAKTIPYRIALSQSGFIIKQGLVIENEIQFNASHDYKISHDLIIYGHKPGKNIWASDGNHSSILKSSKQSTKADPARGTAIEVIETIIRNSTQKGDLILNPFSRSGSALIASQKLGRTALCIDNEPRNCQLTIERWMNLTGERPEILTADGFITWEDRCKDKGSV